MERGDIGPGRDAYGLPGRRRSGTRRGRALREGTEGADASGVNAPQGAKDDDYGQLLRRPGEMPPPHQQRLRQTARPRRPGPARFPASASYLPGGYPASGLPPAGLLPDGELPSGGLVSGRPVSGGLANGGPVNGGPVNGGAMPGRPYRAPDGRLLPPDAGRPYRPQAPGPAAGNRGRPRPDQVRVPGQDRPGGPHGRPGRPPQAPGATPPGVPDGQQGYRGTAGARVAPGTSGSAGISGVFGSSRFGASQTPRGVRDIPVPPDPAGSAGPVIRQRETAMRGEPPSGSTRSVASIAPDGLESFARDLRALRAKAGLDYPEMAELSHFTMKTLVSAAGGLRLPALPVAAAYVRACGGDVAEWEERWQKLATKITAEAARQRRGDGDDQQAPAEPAELPGTREPPAVAAAQGPDPDSGEVYVITSARPRQPGYG